MKIIRYEERNKLSWGDVEIGDVLLVQSIDTRGKFEILIPDFSINLAERFNDDEWNDYILALDIAEDYVFLMEKQKFIILAKYEDSQFILGEEV